MKKMTLVPVLLVGVLVLSSCTLLNSQKTEREDAMKLEGMMPKEDDQAVEAMMEKTEGNTETMMKADTTVQADAMVKDTPDANGSYTVYSESAVSSALAAGKKVILFFHAPWCPTCKAADANFLKETAPANTIVFKTDYDSNVALKKKYGVTYQHTFVSLNTDGSLKKKMSGADTFSELATLN